MNDKPAADDAKAFDPAGAGVLTSRLNLDVIDFQYANTEALPVRLPWINPLLMIPGRLGENVHQENQPTYPPIWFTYVVGARFATAFYDSTDRIVNGERDPTAR